MSVFDLSAIKTDSYRIINLAYLAEITQK